MNADCRLIAYGTLAPGRSNHHQLDGLHGRWVRGTIRGELVQQGWGAALGYPAFIPDPEGAHVEAYVFESAELPEHWARLDEFEGPGYERIVLPVLTDEGPVDASIYMHRQ